MWRSLHALTEPSSDGAAHGGEGYLDLFTSSDSGNWFWCRFNISWYRCCWHGLFLCSQCSLNIHSDDASIRTRALNRAIIQVMLLRQTPGNGRNENASLLCGGYGTSDCCLRYAVS